MEYNQAAHAGGEQNPKPKRGRPVGSGKKPSYSTSIGDNAVARLRSIVERVERLEEERRGLGSDIKDIYTEAASAGFDPKVIKKLVRERHQDPNTVEEMEILLDVYRRALGQLVGTPLANAAMGMQ